VAPFSHLPFTLCKNVPTFCNSVIILQLIFCMLFLHLCIAIYYPKRQAMHYKHNIEARLCNHCCRGRAISITYCEYVFVALVIQHAKPCAVLYCHLWPAWLYHVFLHYLINDTIFGRNLSNIKYVF
jgi:hypothetical protein